MTDSIFLKHLEEVRREKQRIIANNIKYPMNSIIEKLIIYEPNLVKKIWDYIAPTRYNLNADDNVKYISLAPTPKTDTVKSKAFANNKYLEGVFPCIKRFYFNYETGKIQPIYDRSLISLGTEVFANCIKLKRVYFPPSLKTLAKLTFDKCIALESIDIPKLITEIPNGFCQDCSSLKKLKIPRNIKNLNELSFANCESLIEVIFEEGTEIISRNAFQKCAKLEKVILPTDTLTKIDDYAFCMNSELKKIYFPETLTYIGMFAFSQCSLRSVTIPENIKSIKMGAFNTNFYLKRVFLPEVMEEIEPLVFYNCSIEDIIFPLNLKKIGFNAFFGNRFKLIEFPSTIEKICDKAFYMCNSLKQVIFSPNLNFLGKESFTMTSIKEVSLPVNLPKHHFERAFNKAIGEPLVNADFSLEKPKNTERKRRVIRKKNIVKTTISEFGFDSD